MVAFFGSWAIAILLLLRWFHVISKNPTWDDERVREIIRPEPPVIHPRLSSSLS